MNEPSGAAPPVLLSRRFTVVGQLGEGGMGAVYEVVDRERRAHMALKTLRRLSPEGVERLKREFRSLQDLHHPNLVTLGELVEEEGRWAFTMERVHGCSFVQYTRRPLPPQDAPSLDEARLRAALAQLAQGLSALHRASKVHCDLKPSNILVTESGRVVLLDFGELVDLRQASAGDELVVGSAAYMAPEQAAGAPPSPQADWYSVGVLLYRCLTGSLPFSGSLQQIMRAKLTEDPVPPQARQPGLPEDLSALCMELLHRDPAQRPTGEQVLRKLGVQETQEPGSAGILPFVGRQQELLALHTALADCRRGSSVVVWLEGESGVGKSRLVHHFLEEVLQKAPEAPVLSGRCYERESVPYKGVDGLIEGLARHLTSLGESAVRALQPTDTGPLLHLFPVLRRVPGLVGHLAPAALQGEVLHLRAAAFLALRELLERLASRTPVVLTVDDLQWADRDGLALLDEVLRAPGLLLVAAVRADSSLRGTVSELQSARFLREARHLLLEPLQPPESRALVDRLLGLDALHQPEQALRIAEESGGMPLFIDALVRHHREGEDSERPLRLEEALWARIRHLEPPAQALLELLTVARAPLPQSVAAHSTALDFAEYSRLAAALRAAHLARTSGPTGSDTIEVVHDRIRRAALGHQEAASQQRWHSRLALSLEELGTGEPEALAYHWHQAGRVARAAEYYEQAAQQAGRALAFDHQARLYATLLELQPWSEPRRRQLLRARAEALAMLGRGADSARSYLEAAAGLPQAEALELQRLALEQYLRCGHVSQGVALASQVLETTRLPWPRTTQQLVRAARWERWLFSLQPLRVRLREPQEIPKQELEVLDILGAIGPVLAPFDHQRARVTSARYLRRALASGHPRHLARALGMAVAFEAVAAGSRSRLSLRMEQRLNALESRLEEDPTLWGYIFIMRATSYSQTGDFNTAGRLFDRALALLQRAPTHAYWERSLLLGYGGGILGMRGELGRLHELLALPRADAQQRGDVYALAAIELNAGTLRWLALDQPRKGEEAADEVIALYPREGFLIQHYGHFMSRAYVALYEGRGRQVLEELERLWPVLERHGLRRISSNLTRLLEVRTRALLIEAAHPEAQTEPKLCEAERDARKLKRLGTRASLGIAALVQAGVAACRKAHEAPDAYAHAVGLLEHAGLLLHAAAARIRQGQLLGGAQGLALQQAGWRWLREQRVLRPDRMVLMYAPAPLPLPPEPNPA